MEKQESEFYNKLRGKKKGFSREASIWALAIFIATLFIVVGVLDYNADYERETGLGDTQIDNFQIIGSDGTVENRTLQPIFGSASYKKHSEDRGFLPDSIDISIHEWIDRFWSNGVPSGNSC